MLMTDIEQIIQDSISVKRALLNDKELLTRICRFKDMIIDTYRHGGKVLFCGNGGSAADAQHIAAELSGRFYLDRKPLYAEALHCNSSYMTSVSNDYGFDKVFSRAIEATGQKGDVLVGISTSGNSANVLNAMQKAREIGVSTIAMTGNDGGKMTALSDLLINVPSTCTPRIQEAHIMIGHIVCELVEKELFGNE
ncbi:MAG: D-sedoheptulose 7-phosphate isomerase [Bacteroidales bacterium]|nr:D-sedoheptulose 7-phosphate isomerase [Bacteroidales bacterium]